MNKRLLIFLIVMEFFAAAISRSATAQSPYDPSALTDMPTASYNSHKIDDINLISGALQVIIPLAHLPGRGKDFDVEIGYSSKLWTTTYTQPDNALPYWAWTSAGSPGEPAFPFGWELGSPWGVAPGGSSFCGCVFTDLNGDCILFGGTKTGTDDHGHTISYSSPDCSTWYSFDGSYSTQSLSGPGQSISSTFYKDGVRVSTNGNSAIYEDTNGNEISCATVPSTGSCKDTLGRSVSFVYNSNGAPVSASWLDSSGTQRSTAFSFTVASVTPNFATPDDCYVNLQSQTVSLLETITLPNNLEYNFSYDGAGEITKIILPSGGYLRYTYGAAPDYGSGSCRFPSPNSSGQGRAVVSRIESSDGTAGSEKTWTYSYTNNQYVGVTTTVTDPLGNITITIVDGYGVTLETDYESPSGTILRREVATHRCHDFPPFTIYIGETACANPETLTLTTILSDTNQQSEKVFTYGNYSNVTEQDEYDWGTGAPGALIRKTTYSYLNDSNSAYAASTVNILDRRTALSVYDASGCLRAQTTVTYDGSVPTTTANVIQHDYITFPSTFNLRGNMTQRSDWLGSETTTGTCSTSGTSLTTTHTYNDVGDMIQTTDPKGFVTSFDYTDSFYNYAPAQPTLAYVTKTTHPPTNGINHIEKSQHYFYSGLVSAQCEQNFVGANCNFGLAIPQSDYTTKTYDLMNRLLVETHGDGGQKSLAYSDTSIPITATSTTTVNSATSVGHKVVYDGLGRVNQTQLTSDPDGVDYVDTSYDALGRKVSVSNPHRSVGAPTDGTTHFTYDLLDRLTTLTNPDNSIVQLSYSGNCKTVTDEAGRKRENCSDALGRVTQLFEPNSANALVNETDYQYDVLNSLTRVDQKGGDTNSAHWRSRIFTYDSLSRLQSVSYPESGTTSYTYDSNGNIATKTAPAPNQTGSTTISLSYCYDALNRVTSKAYTIQSCPVMASPVATYLYDQTSYNGLTITNGVGRRTGMTDLSGAEAWSFDVEGRALADQRTTNKATKKTTYSYNFDGSTATLTYPSGRTVTYSPSGYGKPISAVDITNSVNFASLAHYSAAGSLCSVSNSSTVVSTFTFNNRLRPVRMQETTAGAPSPPCSAPTQTGNIMDFTYAFTGTSNDNGNVLSIANNRDTTRSQNFTYDWMNRLATAQTTSTASTSLQHCWGESFNIDAWGNLQAIGVSSTSYTGCTQEGLSSSALPNNQLSGFCYDSAGNLTSQSACPGTPYTYDAENHLVGAGGVSYTYDGDGKRVEKSNGKLYWYSITGNVLNESDLNGNIQEAYVYFAGKRIGYYNSSNNYYYYAQDSIGTSRAITTSAGTVCYDADFYPFGGERAYVNTCSQNYKFTGKERDLESGFDNFGARFDVSSLGRFGSPDPLLASGSLTNPQNWNRYSYAGNNPLRVTDPSGLFDWDGSAGGDLSDDSLGYWTEHGDRKTRIWAKRALAFRQRFREALKNAEEASSSDKLTTAQRSAVKAAVDAYGGEQDDNGVNVGTRGGFRADSHIENNDQVSVKFGDQLKGDFLTATVAHEGAHIVQGNAWLDGGETSVDNLSHYQRESSSWEIGASVAEALGMKDMHPHGLGSEYDVWNKGWAAADILTRRAVGIQNILNYMRDTSSDADMRKTYTDEHQHQDP